MKSQRSQMNMEIDQNQVEEENFGSSLMEGGRIKR